jgi:hypothetical protein
LLILFNFLGLYFVFTNRGHELHGVLRVFLFKPKRFIF